MSESTRDHYRDAFRTMAGTLAGVELPWLRKARRHAFDRFETLGFPGTQLEAWKYTNVMPIAKPHWHFMPADGEQTGYARLIDDLVPADAGGRIVFVNGRHVPKLSSLPPLPEGAFVGTLAQAMRRIPERVESIMARRAPEDGFAALNGAFRSDGYVVVLPPGCALDWPLNVLFFSSEAALAMHPFNAVVAQRGARCSIVEQFAGIADEAYFVNTATEIVADEEADVQHCRIQQEARSAFHIAHVGVSQRRASHFTSHSFAFGGALSRTQIDTRLDAEDAQADLNGLYFVSARQHVDHHTRIDHEMPRGTSREYYRGVLDGASHAVFDGRVIVHQDAQQTNAHQGNDNLLLSRNAEIDTKPQLEIHADDVKCTHGATVGQLDENPLFYLRSRGMDERMARALLVWSFARMSVDRVESAALRSRLTQQLLARLPGGEYLRGLS
ncbi:iron-regulated ABC transporter permease protein SufD [Paraburkholderia silvatlantica]|uniref:Iron-regulated ABC transporter permease protein SufD n=1 Tax=Paraburkholderia silvatlantica TaxID=321895 RepID=A0A2V4U0Y9_9BURK|nr:Fe-S cluster assembly protein SufD [Paraburkholderia silvatlantica]PYE24222.1 iron-regulated ABC transporter permease protein SufD [Paraburkholderia silvatlantica]